MGPARAGRGYYRVDEVDIGKYLTEQKNTVSVISTGYYCESFEYFKEPSFVCAEIVSGDSIIAYTGGELWKAYSYNQKIRKVQRYSYQRAFAEVYDMRLVESDTEVVLEVCENKQFIERWISYPEFPRESIEVIYGGGSVTLEEPEKYYDDRAVTKVGKLVDGFCVDDADCVSIHNVQKLKLISNKDVTQLPARVEADAYVAVSMKCNVTGFIDLRVNCVKDTELYLTFDEILVDGQVNFARNRTSNVVLYKLQGGCDYHLITVEPYTFKYLNIISHGGDIELEYSGLIRTDFNESEILISLSKKKSDAVIERIYNAAIETFRQNTFDVFMDCPSREREGWLCDSFFTARVERLVSGKSTVERCFLANFDMEKSYKNIPEGMLPMCYPSDFRAVDYIPNWAMWYLLELKEYLDRTGDRKLVDDIYPKMQILCGYFLKYENDYGLLQNLDGWVFVEWSMCNNLVQNVNYPTNMLYYKFLMTMYELYADEQCREKALKLRETIRRESRMGLFFCDNSVLKEGKLVLSGKRTETCQYYAFFTGVADVLSDKELWETIVNDFGPDREHTKKWQDIYPSNAFIGNYLRLELLSNAGIYDKLEADIRRYFDYMAIRTGTLWENQKESASCNHGFASHVLIWLDKLGYIEKREGV